MTLAPAAGSEGMSRVRRTRTSRLPGSTTPGGVGLRVVFLPFDNERNSPRLSLPIDGIRQRSRDAGEGEGCEKIVEVLAVDLYDFDEKLVPDRSSMPFCASISLS